MEVLKYDINDLMRHPKCVGLHHNQLGNDYIKLANPKMDGSKKIANCGILTLFGGNFVLDRVIFVHISRHRQ